MVTWILEWAIYRSNHFNRSEPKLNGKIWSKQQKCDTGNQCGHRFSECIIWRHQWTRYAQLLGIIVVDWINETKDSLIHILNPWPFSSLSVHCEVGEWSEWSPCSRSGRTCGFKRGQETRTRQVLQYPSPLGKPCPEISEIKECLIKWRKCPGK